MAFVLGRVSRVLRDPEGNSNGMLLDDGQEIRFSAAFGHLVSPIITEGCLVGVKGDRNFRAPDIPLKSGQNWGFSKVGCGP